MSVDEPLDRFGQPLPPDLGYKEIWNADGSKPRTWEKLVLGDGLTVTSDEANKASVLNVGLPSPTGTVTYVTSATGTLRSYFPAPHNGETFITKAYGVYGADLGGWTYRWDAASVATDDGVLVIKADFVDTGRFLAVKPANGMIDAMACGPALANLGTRTLSFDPTAVVPMTTELRRITRLLARAKWNGIVFPCGKRFGVIGGEEVASRGRGQGFILDFTGAELIGPDITGSAQAIGFYARGKGETDAGPVQLMRLGYNSKTWTQTFTGGDVIMTGVADVAGSATVKPVVGETCVLRIGAEQYDAGGWSASAYFAEVAAVTPTTGNAANITFKQPLDMIPPVGVGQNLQRTQGQHDLVIIDEEGFQDNLVIKGFVATNVFLAGIYDRYTEIDGTFKSTTLGVNTTGSHGPTYRLNFEHATGYGVDHYGAPVILQATVGANLPELRVNSDCAVIVNLELSARGTKIGLYDLSWSSRNLPSTRTSVVIGSASCGKTSIDHLILRGGYNNVGLNQNVHIGILEMDHASGNVSTQIRADTCETLIFKGVAYSGMRNATQCLPLKPSQANTISIATGKGIIRFCRLFPKSMTGIVSVEMVVNGIFHINPSALTGGQWNDPNEFAFSYGTTQEGYQSAVITVVTDGSLVAGNAMFLETSMFIPEVQDSLFVDTSTFDKLVGSGAPSANAGWIGQEYFDVTNSIWYMAVGVGGGSADWKATNSSGGLLAANNLSDVASAATSRTNLGLTTAGSNMVTAANVAAQTAILDAATTSLKGLQTAADKVKQDRQPVRIDLTTGTNTSTTYTSPTWAAGLYRRLQLVIWGKSTGAAGGPSTMTLVGASGTESTTINYTSGATTVAADTQASLYIAVGAASGGRFSVNFDVIIPTTDWKEIMGVSGSRETGSTAYHIVKTHHGFKQDSTNAVTGITVLFSGTCDYELELWGYP